MGMKGRKKKLRLQLQKAEAELAEGGGRDESDVDEEECMEALPPGIGPSMEEMAASGKMSVSMRNAMLDEEQSKVFEGRGSEGKRRKRKPWWERSNWWVGKVPKIESLAGEEEATHTGYVPPPDLEKKFSGIGLEKRLVAALTKCGFTTMTEIQRRCIPELMSNNDVLGQAKTGSGKTLAFVVPMLHTLLCEEVNNNTTKGIIIGPTKELCHQIQTVIGRLLSHIESTTVTASLITGGTKVTAEAKQLRKGVTIVVATPGRLLDHMRHTKGWKWKKMVQWLIIDEADRVLMEGYVKEVDAILRLLADTTTRTTALFSATLARGMADLGRLSFSALPLHITDLAYHHQDSQNTDSHIKELDDDEEDFEEFEECEEDEEVENDEGKSLRASSNIDNLNNEESSRAPIPGQARLKQMAIVVPVSDKLIHLYRTLKDLHNSGAKKFIIFFASCASAQFHTMMLNTMMDGAIQCLMLHGKMKHRQRVATFDHFCQAPDGALFATDVAARGLDIPSVEWIIQYDPPTDPSEYLHRVGRTARGGGSGNAILMLCPKEIGFLKFLRHHGVVIDREEPEKIAVDKYHHKLHQLILKDNILEKNARSAYTATVMAYQQHTLKKYFNVKELPLVEVGKAFCLGDTAPTVHLAKGTGEKAPYIKGIYLLIQNV
eukprot:TRINITY_DN3399_c1_g1_i2.p1 TRINITY_DN3399_c1_g1~~TRINITY_DN3399_c1_g1_i2.p1  ORF type:complete len:675 (+),score=169.61 TRINITY_DN3399_c1_g1_i2:45-2027(+)